MSRNGILCYRYKLCQSVRIADNNIGEGQRGRPGQTASNGADRQYRVHLSRAWLEAASNGGLHLWSL